MQELAKKLQAAGLSVRNWENKRLYLSVPIKEMKGASVNAQYTLEFWVSDSEINVQSVPENKKQALQNALEKVCFFTIWNEHQKSQVKKGYEISKVGLLAMLKDIGLKVRALQTKNAPRDTFKWYHSMPSFNGLQAKCKSIYKVIVPDEMRELYEFFKKKSQTRMISYILSCGDLAFDETTVTWNDLTTEEQFFLTIATKAKNEITDFKTKLRKNMISAYVNDNANFAVAEFNRQRNMKNSEWFGPTQMDNIAISRYQDLYKQAIELL